MVSVQCMFLVRNITVDWVPPVDNGHQTLVLCIIFKKNIRREKTDKHFKMLRP